LSLFLLLFLFLLLLLLSLFLVFLGYILDGLLSLFSPPPPLIVKFSITTSLGGF